MTAPNCSLQTRSYNVTDHYVDNAVLVRLSRVNPSVFRTF
jgi:hypothetical protein